MAMKLFASRILHTISLTKAPTKKLPLEIQCWRCGYCLFELAPNLPLLPLDAPFDKWFKKNPRPEESTYFIHRDLLLKSAGRGCKTCRILHDGFVLRNPSKNVLEWMRGAICGQRNSIEIILHTTDFGQSSFPYSVHPFVDIGKIPRGNTGTLPTLSILDTWIAMCFNSHTNCEVPQPSKLPQRLLFVGSMESPEVRLVDGTSRIGHPRYACLSHRWNSTTKASGLTSHRLTDFIRSIPEDSLLPVFRDAIQVVRHLRLSYLWIDCFCIIQDDTRDWQHQAGMMADIYEQSYICISALTCKGDPSDRLFVDDIEPPYWFLKLFGDGRTEVFMRDVGSDNHPFSPGTIHTTLCESSNNSHYFPLTRRAWVFQERLLAPRILHFTESELIWECRQAHWCECRFREADWKELRKKELKQPQDQSWHNIVENYSRLDLSFETDRFTALAGIAQRFSLARGLNYLAGLWVESLIHDIMWIREGFSELRPRPYALESGYVPPSWSWASVMGPVKFHRAWGWDNRKHIKVVSYSSDWATSNKFMAPTSAEIVLECNGLWGILLCKQDGGPWLKQLPGGALTGSGKINFGIEIRNQFGQFNPDYDMMDILGTKAPFESAKVLCILVDEGINWANGNTGVGGLVLRRTSNYAPSYKRIGSFGYDSLDPREFPPGLFGSSSRIQITLV
jgi:hypothetical protein